MCLAWEITREIIIIAILHSFFHSLFSPLSLSLFSLGAGTFGTVRQGIYRPLSGEPPVKCALKFLKPTEELPNQKAEILREADAMAMLDHPNIVRLYGKNLPPSLSLSLPPLFLSLPLSPSLPLSSLSPSSLSLLPYLPCRKECLFLLPLAFP